MIAGPNVSRNLADISHAKPRSREGLDISALRRYGIDNIWLYYHILQLKWTVLLDSTFEPEFEALPTEVQDELLAHAKLLEIFGPQLGRPRADTLKGSRHANMKELRFDAADGVWRIAFAFDPTRNAIFLVAGDKAGTSEKRFYKRLISKADERFDEHLKRSEGIKRR